MSTAATSELRNRQGELGQFLTPSPVAEFMASMFAELPKNVRLLDAGAGAGELTRAFVSRVCAERSVESIHVTLYELDMVILPALNQAMGECRRLCENAGIRFGFTLHTENFITEVANTLASRLFVAAPPAFDVAIVKPTSITLWRNTFMAADKPVRASAQRKQRIPESINVLTALSFVVQIAWGL